MIKISAADIIAFVRSQGELQLQTHSKRIGFTVSASDDGLVYLPSTTKERRDGLQQVVRICEEFTLTNSFKPADYKDIAFNASYALAVIRAFLAHKKAAP